MNRIVLVGRLESTPDLRHTSTGIPVANFSLSVRRSIPNGQGKYERDIFRIVTWRKLAETCCKFLERGRMIAVDGKLQNRILQSPGGDRKIIVEVHADDVRFLEGAKPRENNSAAGTETRSDDSEDNNRDSLMSDSVDSTENAETVSDETEDKIGVPALQQRSPAAGKSGETDNNWFNEETDGTPLEF